MYVCSLTKRLVKTLLKSNFDIPPLKPSFFFQCLNFGKNNMHSNFVLIHTTSLLFFCFFPNLIQNIPWRQVCIHYKDVFEIFLLIWPCRNKFLICVFECNLKNQNCYRKNGQIFFTNKKNLMLLTNENNRYVSLD